MRSAWIWALLWLSTFGAVPTSAAEDSGSVDQIILRLSEVYQIDRINKASTIRLEEDRRVEYPDHEYSADFHQLSAQRFYHVLDFKNELLSRENVTQIANSTWHGRDIVKDGQSRFIIYAHGVYRDQGEVDFAAEYARTVRSSAVLIARQIAISQDSVTPVGEQMWLGKMHDVVTFEMATSPPLTVFIEKQSGLISLMKRTVGDIKVSYTFRRYSTQEGIPVATEHSIYANGDRLFFSYGRRLIVDDPLDKSAFEIDAGIVAEGALADQSTMTVDRLHGGAFHVGENESYSTFFVGENGVIAFGLTSGFADRLIAFREATKIELPLTHAIIGDLHLADRLGASDAAMRGATLIVTPDADLRIKSMFADSDTEPKIQTIDSAAKIGELSVHNLATAQAAQNLVVYHPPSGVLAQTSHFSNPFPDRPGYADYTAVTLRDAVMSVGIVPDLILSTETRRAEVWDQFLLAVDNHNATPCHFDRPICKGW